MAIIKSFTPDTLLAYITENNPTLPSPLTTQVVTLSPPATMTGDTNTYITLSGTGVESTEDGNIYIGQNLIRYNRLALDVLFRGIDVVYERSNLRPDETLHDWLPKLSEQQGVDVYANDMEDVVLGNTTGSSIRVYSSLESINYTGSLVLTIIDVYELLDIATLNPVLDIYYLTHTPSDFRYGYDSGKKIQTLPFNGSLLTVGVRFDTYADLLDELLPLTKLTTTRQQEMIPLILRSEFGVALTKFDNERIILAKAVNEGDTTLYLKLPGARDYLAFTYTPTKGFTDDDIER